MNKKNYLLAAAAFLAAGNVFTSCENDDNANDAAMSLGKYVVSAKSQASGGNGEANYIITSESLNSGEATTIGAGIEAATGTEWVFYKDKYLFRLQYNQGEAGTTESYYRDENGNIKKRDILYSIKNRFTTFGTYGNFIITAASIDLPLTDESKYSPKGLGITYLDAVNQKFMSKTINAENILGNGEYVTFSGILEANGKIYTAIIPLGMSAYGIEKYPECADKGLLNGSSSTTELTITGTQHPNEAWVAIYNDTTFTNPTLIKTDRISYACGRMRSQYYQTIWAADNGDVYVFSPNYSRTSTGIQQSNYKSGVVRIKKGANAFDENYYIDIETAANAPLYRCWHLTGDYFLMQFYSGEFNAMGQNVTRLAIFKGEEGTVTPVTGLPSEDVISSFSKFPFSENGMGYISVVTTDGADPAIYCIDPATGKAVKGLTVNAATEISAMGILK